MLAVAHTVELAVALTVELAVALADESGHEQGRPYVHGVRFILIVEKSVHY